MQTTVLKTDNMRYLSIITRRRSPVSCALYHQDEKSFIQFNPMRMPCDVKAGTTRVSTLRSGSNSTPETMTLMHIQQNLEEWTSGAGGGGGGGGGTKQRDVYLVRSRTYSDT